MSGHADRQHLTDWVSQMKKKPKRIFVVHGEDSVCDEFAEHLTKETGCEATAPYSGDTYDLLTNTCTVLGSRAPAKPKKKEASNVFKRLLAAGERLIAVIKRCEGRPNKDLSRFTDQINNLCDKWEK